jgi:hypothetical protein
MTDWSTGYSGSPLPKKLGVKAGQRVSVLGAPEGFVEQGLQPLPDGVEIARQLGPSIDLAVAFVRAGDELARLLPALSAATAPDGAFWIAWPKRASGVPTDLTEDRIRDVALPRGLVDTKVCSISPIWSGLRLCLRRELRRRSGRSGPGGAERAART